MLKFQCLIFFLTAGTVIPQQPLNAVASLGDRVIFNCTTPIISQTSWYLSNDGTTTNQITITFGCPGSPPLSSPNYALDVGSNYCNLIVTNITMQQAGVYQCTQGSTTYNALLTVIDLAASKVTVHNLTDIAEYDTLNVTCTVAYSGWTSPAPTMPPQLFWLIPPEQDFTVIGTATTPNEVASYGQLTVKPPTVPTLQCSANFSLIGSLSGFAMNIPTNVYVWNISQVYDVLSAPTTPSISTKTVYIHINGPACTLTELTCNSTSNPPPNYEWADITGEERKVLAGANVYSYAEDSRTYQCTAFNNYRGSNHSSSAVVTIGRSSPRPCVSVASGNMQISGPSCSNNVCSCADGKIELTCLDNSFPLPDYRWYRYAQGYTEDLGTNQTIMDQYNGVYNCTANNRFSEDLQFTGTTSVSVINCSTLPPIPSTSPMSATTFEITASEPLSSSPTPGTTPSSNNYTIAVAMAILMGILFGISLVVNIIQYVRLRMSLPNSSSSQRQGNGGDARSMQLSQVQTSVPTYEELHKTSNYNTGESAYQPLTPRPVE